MSVKMHAGNHRGLDAYGHLRASCHHLDPRTTFLNVDLWREGGSPQASTMAQSSTSRRSSARRRLPSLPRRPACRTIPPWIQHLALGR
jgi:hypothetical protein